MTDENTYNENNQDQENQDKGNENDSQNDLEAKLDSKVSKLEEKISKLAELMETKQKPKKEEKQQKNEDSQNLSLKKLNTQIESLRNELEEKERKNLENERNNKIKDKFFREGVQFVDSAMNLFLSENKEKMKVENDQWFVEEGEKVYDLEDYVNQFMERPEIKSFKAKSTKGANLKPPEKEYPSSSKEQKGKKSSLNDTLFVED